MPDIRELLDESAPSVRDVDMTGIERRARRRKAVPRLAAGVVLVAIIGAGVLVSTHGDDAPRRIETGTTPSTSPTTAPLHTRPDVVDPRTTDPAAALSLRRCTADDLQFARAESIAAFGTLGVDLYFAPNHTSSCALLSYPEVQGQTGAGAWEAIPLSYLDQDAISSFAWDGVFAPPGGAPPAGYGVVARLASTMPSSFTDGKCPGAPVVARDYSQLRLVLRDGGGIVALPGATFTTTGCATTLTRFGFESRDGAGLVPTSTLPPGTGPLDGFRLGFDGLGPVKLGMTLAEASNAAGTTIALQSPSFCGLPDTTATATGYYEHEGEQLWFGVDGGRIVNISTKNPVFSTVSGIRVGGTREDVFRTYPTATVPIPGSAYGEIRLTDDAGRVVAFYAPEETGQVGFIRVASDERYLEYGGC